ncbi:MAG: DUF899 family protein [Chthoniobacterales bacterium]
MVKIDKEYEFDGPHGKERLADLFDGRSQLIVYHFMLGAGWKEGCEGCSFLADHVDGARIHFEHHDVTFVAVSRAPQSEIERFKRRMGWRFKWVSSYGSEFNFDFHVSPTKDEMAKGKMYTTMKWWNSRAKSSPVSVCFTRTNPATSSTPIPHTHAGATCYSVPITTSTSRLSDARKKRGTGWIGYGTTTDTRPVVVSGDGGRGATRPTGRRSSLPQPHFRFLQN